MKEIKRYAGVDFFRIPAAALVVAIHTSPLASFDAGADFFLTRVLARIAVPFFFMVTGQFVVSGLWDMQTGRVMRYVKKTALLYGIAMLLYLPAGIYAGHYQELTFADVLRMLVFDGTFYHLWYFPACITGICLLYLLSRFLNKKQVFAAAVLLYIIGLGGDSYYGLAKQVPFFADFYETCFSVCSYTRNGIFMAPLFFMLGVLADEHIPDDRRILWAGLCVSFPAMTEEAYLLRAFRLQRHDSMYVLLPVVMFFLYRLLRGRQIKGIAYVVPVSTRIYILHPAMILVVRAAAKVTKFTILTENSLVHYAAVLLLSAAVSLLPVIIRKRTGQMQKASAFGARAWLEVDHAALGHNVKMLQEMLPQSCKLMPAVKADAYGHGAVLVAKELQKAGVDAFCVACAAEGVRLRRQGIRGLILVLDYTHPQQFPLLVRYKLTQTVVDDVYAERLNRYGKTIHVHIGIDTGMHRIGVRSEHMEQILHICQMRNLSVDGLFTHLCTSDVMTERFVNYTVAQAQAFYHVVEQMQAHGYACPALHMQASYGVLNYPELAGDYARVGIALYGVLSTKEDTEQWSNCLKPVLSLKARIASVRTLYQGESAGYGIQYTAERDMRIATLSVGYADGLPRALSCGVGSVLIHGCLAPVIGRICMDQMTVDISGISNVRAGEEAVLIGRCGDLEISVCDVAKQAGTITNEILSRMGARLERVRI